MTDMNNPSQDDLWLEQQLAEAHALLGDIPAAPQPQESFAQPQDAPFADPQPVANPFPQEAPPRNRSTLAYEEERRKAPRKDRVVPVLVGVIVLELLGIAGVALYWVNMLT